MKLRRFLSRLAVSLWLVPLMIILVLWGRSHFRLDEFSRVTDEYRTQAVVSYQGALHFIQSGKTASPRPLAWDALVIPERATIENLYTTGVQRWRWLGFARIGSSPRVPPRQTSASPSSTITPAPSRPAPTPRAGSSTPPAAALAPWLMLNPLNAWIVPYWALAVVFCLPAIRRAAIFSRRLIRRRRRKCVACGYDLRASPTRCPECGAGAIDDQGRPLAAG